MPTSACSPTSAQCTTQPCPTVALRPITRVSPGAACRTELSCTLAPSRITIVQMSARSTAPYQMLAPCSTVTSPIRVAVGATNASGWTVGRLPSNSKLGMGLIPHPRHRSRLPRPGLGSAPPRDRRRPRRAWPVRRPGSSAPLIPLSRTWTPRTASRSTRARAPSSSCGAVDSSAVSRSSAAVARPTPPTSQPPATRSGESAFCAQLGDQGVCQPGELGLARRDVGVPAAAALRPQVQRDPDRGTEEHQREQPPHPRRRPGRSSSSAAVSSSGSADSLALGDSVGVSDSAGVSLGVADSVGSSVGVGVTVSVTVSVGVGSGDSVGVGSGDSVGVGSDDSWAARSGARWAARSGPRTAPRWGAATGSGLSTPYASETP